MESDDQNANDKGGFSGWMLLLGVALLFIGGELGNPEQNYLGDFSPIASLIVYVLGAALVLRELWAWWMTRKSRK